GPERDFLTDTRRGRFTSRSRLVDLGFGVTQNLTWILLLGGGLFALLGPSRTPVKDVELSVLLNLALVHLVFFGDDRFHVPLVPFLCIVLPEAWEGSLRSRRAVRALALASGALGGVQFVRSSIDHATWMFGHWRVAPARRREGIGRRLLSEGSRFLPGIGRLYSYIDWGNEVSVLAHERLGFEACPLARGSALLGALSTVGPSAPALGFEPRRRSDWPALFDLYRKAAGPIWFGLFPR